MAWEYRILHYDIGPPEEQYFTLVEYYDVGAWAEVSPSADNLEGLSWVVKKFEKAFDKPILRRSDFEN